MTDHKPILCLDFDGVCHSYTSGWINAWTIPDAPVPGLFPFLEQALNLFRVAIYSTRSEFQNGRDAMGDWFNRHAREYYHARLGLEREYQAEALVGALEFPATKPPALVTLDDRAMTFTGTWPEVTTLRGFIPWNAHLKIKKPQPERESVPYKTDRKVSDG